MGKKAPMSPAYPPQYWRVGIGKPTLTPWPWQNEPEAELLRNDSVDKCQQYYASRSKTRTRRRKTALLLCVLV